MSLSHPATPHHHPPPTPLDAKAKKKEKEKEKNWQPCQPIRIQHLKFNTQTNEINGKYWGNSTKNSTKKKFKNMNTLFDSNNKEIGV